MTINLSDNDPRIEYTVAQGVTQSAFVVPFEFFDDDDLNVYVDSVLQTLTTHYTTADDSGNTQQHTSGTTGYIHFTSGNEVTGATGGSDVVITRDIDIDRVTDFPTSGPFDVSSLNNELDRMIAISADIKDTAERALILQDYDTTTSLQLPDVATRANKILSFTATGDATVSQSIGIFQGSDATVTTQDYLRHDLVKSTTAAQLDNVYIAMQDSPSGTLLTNTAYWALVVDAVSAATYASNSASSASASATSASNAATSESNAATSETNAAASYDSFDDRYLGAKASDPLTDNDGDALITGALYFNSADGDMRVYNGSAWINVVSSLGNLANIVEDSTPQLGGNLESNGQDILMADDDAVIIGTDTDLTIVHDSGVNNTLFKSDTLEFKSKANANLTFKIAPGATKAAVLYYQGSERLAIESGTSRFTGGINTDTATIASLAYPTSDGTNGQVLTTNGSGTLSFQDVTETDPSALAFAIALG